MSVINTAPQPEQNEVQSSNPRTGATSNASITAVLIAAGIVAVMLITFANGLDESAAVAVDSAVESAVVGQSNGALLDSYSVPSYGQFAGLDAREFPNGSLATYATTGQSGSTTLGSAGTASLGLLPELDAREYPSAVINTVRPASSEAITGVYIGPRAADYGQFAGLNAREYPNASAGEGTALSSNATTNLGMFPELDAREYPHAAIGPLINPDAGAGEGAAPGSDANTSQGAFPELDAREIPNGVIDGNSNSESRSSSESTAIDPIDRRRASFTFPRVLDAIGNPTSITTSTIDLGIWPHPEVHGDVVGGDSQTQVGAAVENAE